MCISMMLRHVLFFFCSQLNLIVLVMTLHKMHSTAALKPDSSRHDNLRYRVTCCSIVWYNM